MQDNSLPPAEDGYVAPGTETLQRQFDEATTTLPEGDTGVPQIIHAVPAARYIPETLGGISLPFEFKAALANLPEETFQIVCVWVPYCYMRESEYLNGRIVLTPHDVLDHVRGYQAAFTIPVEATQPAHAPAPPTVQPIDKRIAWNVWTETCKQRKQHIADLKAEVDKRKGERAKAEQEWRKQMSAHMIQWDNYVKVMEDAYRQAKAIPPPARPA